MYAAAHTAAVVRQLIQGQPAYLFHFSPKTVPTKGGRRMGFSNA